jgi:hypothetical protein
MMRAHLTLIDSLFDRTGLKGWHDCQFGTKVTNGYTPQALQDEVVLPDTGHKTVLSCECTLGTTRAKYLSVGFAI